MYIKIDTLAYPVNEQEIRDLHPNVSFKVPFEAPKGYAQVHGSPQPDYDQISEGIRELKPTNINGKWAQQWEVYKLPDDVIEKNTPMFKERLVQSIVDQTQSRLDDFAKTRNYDGILSLATYATSTNPKFQAEGQYGVEARDATWAKLYEMMAEVEAGTRPMPEGYTDVEPELPVLEWPVA